VSCEKQKRKASLGTAVPVYNYRKYPASCSNSPINFTKLPVVLSSTYAILTRLVYNSFTSLIATSILEMILNRSALYPVNPSDWKSNAR